MRPLISILRAAHCRSTHHYFAIDALANTESDAGARLGQILLRHHDRYLAGAKDPDTRFRDFHNHVVHVTDGYWGGAPAKAIRWYERLQKLLAEDRWSEAAHAMGVLSHYVTDPMQPLHTAQSKRETLVHRPLEWSITKSYESIRKQWLDSDVQVRFQLSNQPGWLAEAILHGARVAHRSYDLLINSYNLKAGVKNPPRGLNAPSRAAIAELFGLATVGLAKIIDRAAQQAEQQRGGNLPTPQLTTALVLAGIRVPHRMWLRRIENRHEQAAVEELLEEYQRCGELREHLPQESKTVQRSIAVYHRDRARRRQAKQSAAAKLYHDEGQGGQETFVEAAQRLEQQRQAAMERAEQAIRQAEQSRTANPTTTDSSETLAPAAQTENVESIENTENTADEFPATIPFRPRLQLSGSRLSVRASIVEAPSIGPKTAARFEAIGIETVGDLLEAPAAATARRLATRWIDEQRLADWQAQAELMCSVPNLIARDVKLLVGSGCRTSQKLADSDVDGLHKSIARFAVTSDGRRALRGAEPPEKEDIGRWIASANPNRSAAA